jgi:hypothetical protein
MDESAEQFSKADSSMHLSLDPDSNVTDERDWHPLKHIKDSRSTEAGIQRDESDEQRSKS